MHDDFDNQLGDSQENLLATALYHIENNTCPIVVESSSAKQPSFTSQATQEAGLPLKIKLPLYKNNMDLTRPLPAKEGDNE